MTESIIKGLGLGLILVLSVGPVIFTILKQSLNNGHRGGFSFIAGVWISDIILVVVSNMFSELVRQMLEYKSTIALVGSGFLVAMGIYYVFFKKVKLTKADLSNTTKFSKSDFARIMLSGFFINTLNPSVMLFWLVNATAFAVNHSIWQRIVIFSVCLALNMIADVLKVLMAGKIRDKLTVHNISLINKISGTILVIFGLALAYGVVALKNNL
ncbi:LysE family translocator [Pollutibacter soli]|uniref:LysE family translocator n=1 Tax=Pollutibacter soli TaxID=3034157 RepID=UPI0030135006